MLKCNASDSSGITNDSKDPSVDTFRSTTLPMLKQFGVPSEGLDLKIESRGAPPQGGGEILLTVPIVEKLTVSFKSFVSPPLICNLCESVYIYTHIHEETEATRTNILSRDNKRTKELVKQRRKDYPAAHCFLTFSCHYVLLGC